MGAGVLTAVVVAFGLWLGTAPAFGASFTVNDSGDAPDALADGLCATAEGVCTLRAAVEEANRTPALRDEVGVSPAVADAVDVDSTIQVTAPLSINGCSADLNRPEPCLQVLVRALPGFEVLADDVQISGIAFRGTGAITLEEGFAGLHLTNNWFGVRPDGSAERSFSQGFAVTLKGPDSIIGGTGGASGTEPADRNVFASDDMKVRIVGADDTTLQGNYFGVEPDGFPGFTGFSAVRIERGPNGEVAEGTLIGGVPEGAAAASPECDGPCNIFTRHQRGVELDPNNPPIPGAAGASTIQGNYFALTPSGLESDSMGVGAWVGAASEVTVGGDTTAAGNRFGWSAAAVFARSPTNLEVRRNTVGLNAVDEVIHPNSDAGIWLEEDLTSTVIADNRIAGLEEPQTDPNPQYGIVLLGDGAIVVGNEIGVDDSLGSPEFFTSGVYIEGDGNVIGTEDPGDGNVIRNAGEAGVLIVDGRDNLVTGNRIDGSSGPAVLVEGAASIGNEVAVNLGAHNSGRFIDLEEVDFVHGGLEPPVVAGARAETATGMGVPGAAILVFSRPDGGDQGDVAAFLGEGTIDADGLWTVPLSSAVESDSVVALQITADGSSELSDPVPLGNPGDGSPPQASLRGPGPITNDSSPTFVLEASEPAAFLCRLEGEPWAGCGSSHTTAPLGDGAHTFHALAVDAAGNSSDKITSTFTIDTVAPETLIVAGPSGEVDSPVAFRFGSNEPSVGFTCRLDLAAVRRPCPAGWQLSLLPGPHEVHVVARDAAGNADPTPAHRKFSVRGEPASQAPTLAQLRAGLRTDLRRVTARLRQLGVAGLLESKRHRLARVTALTAGTFRLRATATGLRLGAGRRVVVLAGAVRRQSAGRAILTAKLTRDGRTTLRHRRRPLALRVELRFTDLAGRSVVARSRTRLHGVGGG